MIDPAENNHIVALEGEIDMHESPQVRERFEPLIAQRTEKVVVDLSRVSYIDSSGLAVLIDAMQRIQAYGGKLALFGIRESVKTIFEIARLDKVFAIFTDRSAALQA
jgi:anti-sigma B factor antagonist